MLTEQTISPALFILYLFSIWCFHWVRSFPSSGVVSFSLLLCNVVNPAWLDLLKDCIRKLFFIFPFLHKTFQTESKLVSCRNLNWIVPTFCFCKKSAGHILRTLKKIYRVWAWQGSSQRLSIVICVNVVSSLCPILKVHYERPLTGFRKMICY